VIPRSVEKRRGGLPVRKRRPHALFNLAPGLSGKKLNGMVIFPGPTSSVYSGEN